MVVMHSPNLQVRQALPEDIPVLFEIRTQVRENHLSREALTELGITPETLVDMLTGDGCGWVIEWDGRVVAFSMANAPKKNIFALFVLPGYEGRGSGRLLLNEAEQWLFVQGFQDMCLLTDHNPSVRAYGFYRHFGWIEDGIQKDDQMRFVKLF